jgi:hypothetical protein
MAPQSSPSCGRARRRTSPRRTALAAAAAAAGAVLLLAGGPAIVADAAASAADANAAIVPSPNQTPIMLGYQEGARRRARCVSSSSNSRDSTTTKPAYLQGLDLHFLPAMGGGGGAYADPFLAGVNLRCSTGLARVEYDPPGLPAGKDARSVFGQDLRARAEAASAAGASDGAVVKAALCPPGFGVVGVAWRPARPSGDAKEDGQPMRVGGVTVYCGRAGEDDEKDEPVAVAVDPAPEASAPPPHTQRARLGCGGDGKGRVVSELEMWHDDVFNGFSVAGCVL